MEKRWCWRCKMQVPMLDEEEFAIAHQFYCAAFKSDKPGLSRTERFKPLLEFYRGLTGFNESEPNAIMHPRVALYGPPCEKCGKPYRTPDASMCAACGNKKMQ